jgi:hypothetical protein
MEESKYNALARFEGAKSVLLVEKNKRFSSRSASANKKEVVPVKRKSHLVDNTKLDPFYSMEE